MRILVAEDDPELGPTLKRGLEASAYAVDLATEGEDAVAMGLAVAYDLLILDILLPRLDGFGVCAQLRQRGRTMPILVLTALSDIDHRVAGLDLGADDYLVKPFAFRELEARVRALLRRESPVKSSQLRFLDIRLDTKTREVQRGERRLLLTKKEYAMLELLLLNPHQVLSRSVISDRLWDFEGAHFSNVVDVYILYLRRKLCARGEPDVIQTIRGVGYQLKEPGR